MRFYELLPKRPKYLYSSKTTSQCIACRSLLCQNDGTFSDEQLKNALEQVTIEGQAGVTTIDSNTGVATIKFFGDNESEAVTKARFGEGKSGVFADPSLTLWSGAVCTATADNLGISASRLNCSSEYGSVVTTVSRAKVRAYEHAWL